jgi:hypothetical protein
MFAETVTQKLFKETFAALRVGQAITFKNLTVFPLTSQPSEPDYMVLDEALDRKTARVTEVSEQGSVPDLRFVNEGDSAVLLVDGEELIGAKQNRILNISILVSARSEVKIPVSCVEAGRWARQFAAFRSSSRVHYASGRSMKMMQVTSSMIGSGRRSSDQSAVWHDIDVKMQRLKSSSPTSAMSAMYENNSNKIEEYVGAFKPEPHQAGAVFAVDGKIVGLDLFDTPATFTKLFPKLLRSYALDVIDDQKPDSSATDALAFLNAVKNSKEEVFKGVGEGDDIRLSAPGIAGAALYARGRLIHLAAFVHAADN